MSIESTTSYGYSYAGHDNEDMKISNGWENKQKSELQFNRLYAWNGDMQAT